MPLKDLKLVRLLIGLEADRLFADRTEVLGLKPWLDTGFVEPVKTHQKQVGVPDFVVRLANRAQLVFI